MVSTHKIPDAYCMLQVLVHENCTRSILHVTGVSTWELYQMHIVCYRRSLLLLIVAVDKKHYCYSTYLSRLCFSDIDRFYWIWFFSFLLSYLQFGFLCNWYGSRWVGVGEFCSPLQFSNCSTVTATRIFDL